METRHEFLWRIYLKHSVILDTSNLQPLTSLETTWHAIARSETPVRRKFSQHIDIHRHFVRGLVKAGIVQLVSLRTHKMVVDTLTKSQPWPSPVCIAHRKVMLGQVPFPVKFWGGCRNYILT